MSARIRHFCLNTEMTSSAVITPASLPSSSTTGKVSRLYLSKSSVTRSCFSSTVTWINVSEASSLRRALPLAMKRRASGMAAERRSSLSTRNRVFRVSSRSSLPRKALMASATVAASCSATYSVFIMPPAVSSRNSRSSRTSVLGAESISSRISSLVSSSSSERRSAASSGAISSTISAAFSGSRDSRMLACILGSSTSERAQAAQRVGFDDVGELPGDGPGRNGALQAADPGGRQDALEDAAQDAADPDIDVHDVERIAHAIEQDAHGDVVDADHLPAGHVDDLLVEKVAGDAQQVLIVMVGDEDFLAELDAFGERNGVHLIEAYGEPGVGAAHQEPVDAGGVDKGDHGGVLDAADPAAFEVHHRHGQQFREIEEILRHRQRPNARPMRAPRLGRKFDSGTDALYTAFGR